MSMTKADIVERIYERVGFRDAGTFATVLF